MNKFIVHTDGGSRGNPGPAAIGVVICNDKNQPTKKYSEYIEEATNNEAEYSAVIFALKKVRALFGKEKIKTMEIKIRLDSELVAKQLNHQYKIQEENLGKLFLKIWNLLLDFGKVSFKQIKREENQEADRLVNEALDNQGRNQMLL